ncbi:hypothetical protein VO54_00540 [Elizabethkingia miricola]|nr:hypothetical protein VO54_00540 [Elizabethkingia miricola]
MLFRLFKLRIAIDDNAMGTTNKAVNPFLMVINSDNTNVPISNIVKGFIVFCLLSRL